MRVDYRSLKPYREYQRARMFSLRLVVIQVLIVLGFVFFGSIFWYLQIVKGEEYRLKAENNRLKRAVITPLRGVVRDHTGRILVSNRPVFAVYLDRERSTDPESDIAALAEALDISPEPLAERLEEARRRRWPRFRPVMLLDEVDLETAARIEARQGAMPSIQVEMEARRHYPLGPAAAHVIGYTQEANENEVSSREGIEPGDRVGRTGIERSFDEELRGRPGIEWKEVNALGRTLEVVRVERSARHGRSVRLTLDAAMQENIQEAFGDRAGAAVFLEPDTGAIRGFYLAPSFDPNMFSGHVGAKEWNALISDPRHPLQNRALEGTYSPGSIFKIVVASAALQEGVIKADDTIKCLGAKRFYDRVFHCHRKWGHGDVALHESLARSCNIFYYTIGQELGIERIAEWARRFGLGRATGLGVSREATGLVPSPEWSLRVRKHPWWPGETISVSIGQGPLNVTPIQMAVMAAAIANGGNLITPYLRASPGTTPAPQPIGLSAETIKAVTAAMEAVVEADFGTARRARVPGIHVAGKTGTVQTVGRDAVDNPGDHAWFIGFGPVSHPRLAWAVVVEHVEEGGGGGKNAAPIAGYVLKRYLERHPTSSDGDAKFAKTKRDGTNAVALREE